MENENKNNCCGESGGDAPEAYRQGLADGRREKENELGWITKQKIQDAHRAGYRHGFGDGRSAGRNEVWNTFKDVYFDQSGRLLEKLDKSGNIGNVLENYTAGEFLMRLGRGNTEPVRVGNEVSVVGTVGRYTVIRLSEDGKKCLVADLKNFDWSAWYDRSEVRKTGRHFDSVEKMVEEIGSW